ncbi:hypothetical protein BDZ90DRAFT_260436 [Jaminaea rosea]|uniref:Pentacotripeptide-repeat region of PRORP domain-containing protein n=1 Tax=Jaminaea rosea TaxID=1569628 RepID=A0A316UQT8_9BASI|nr:hypothetical protein BDZ90DRAFT_260436 [Jaminaea rosea]PWN27344.1 hypothetical protein BDZ90DRAFT_260436 [Jaminaea rosea]
MARRRDVRRLIDRYWQSSRAEDEGSVDWIRRLAHTAIDRQLAAGIHDELQPWTALFMRNGRLRDALALVHHYFATAQLHRLPMRRRLPANYTRDSFRTVLLLIYLETAVNGGIAAAIPLLRGLPLAGERTSCYLSRDAAARGFFERGGIVTTPEIVDQTLRLLRPAELALALSRDAEEVGSEPLAKLMGNLLARPESEQDATLPDLPAELCREIINASDPKKNAAAWLWVDGLDKPPGWEAPISVTPPRPDIGESTWSVLLRGFITTGRQELAAQVWAHINTLGIKPSAQLWNSLLAGYSAAGRWESMMQTWQQLNQQRDSPVDVYCYTTVINGFFRQGNIEVGMSMFEELRTRAAKEPHRFRVTAETYNSVIQGLNRARYYHYGEHILGLMKSSERHASVPAPTTSTWNTMLRSHARKGDMDALRATLAEASTYSFTPDIVTFVTVLDAMARQGGASSDAVRIVRGLMDSRGVRLNTVGWTALIKGALRCNLEDEVQGRGDEAVEYGGEDMEQRSMPLAIRVRQVVSGMGMLNEMVASGIEPNSITITSLIHAAFRLQAHVDLVQPGHDDLSSLARQLLGAPECKDTMRHLVPISDLKETSEALQNVTAQRPGAALAMALLQRMQDPITYAAQTTATAMAGAGTSNLVSTRRRAPDSGFGFALQGRKTFHVVLAGLLGPNNGTGSSLVWRTTLVRGMMHLDALTLPRGGAQTSLTPLVNTSPSSSMTPRTPTSGNDVSYRVVLLALLRRLAASQEEAGSGVNRTEQRLVLAVLDQVMQRLEHAAANAAEPDGEGRFIVSNALGVILKRVRDEMRAAGYRAPARGANKDGGEAR